MCWTTSSLWCPARYQPPAERVGHFSGALRHDSGRRLQGAGLCGRAARRRCLSALAPEGELLVYGALSTHRQTDPSALTIPLFARSVIYDAKKVRGFWLLRWAVTTPPEETRATLAEARNLVTEGILHI